MGYRWIALPEGFDQRLSFIRWQGWVAINNSDGDPGGSFHQEELPTGGKLTEIVRAHPNGGTVQIMIHLNYRLVKVEEAPGPLTTTMEQNTFQFGCEWPYDYSDERFSFGPAQKFTVPVARRFARLQGSCQDVQSRDAAGSANGNGKGAHPFVCASAVLSMRSAPGESNGWMYLPAVGGPAESLAGESPTPEGGFRLGSFWIDLEIRPEAAPRRYRLEGGKL